MKCSNCGEEMIEDYDVKIKQGLLLTYLCIKKDYDEKELKALVCPKCGKVELYTKEI